MKIQIDNIPKTQRKYFKDNLLKAINGNGNVYFTLDKAIIETKEPYIPTIESMKEKSNNKQAINTFLEDFRLYQFNKG